MSTLDAYQGPVKEEDTVVSEEEFNKRMEYFAKISEGQLRKNYYDRRKMGF
jgi:hypothetical protein